MVSEAVAKDAVLTVMEIIREKEPWFVQHIWEGFANLSEQRVYNIVSYLEREGYVSTIPGSKLCLPETGAIATLTPEGAGFLLRRKFEEEA